MMTVSRVCIVGNVASGKSHLSHLVSDELGLPIIHLDSFYWRPDWSRVPIAECQARQAEVIKEEKWILDGCFIEFGLTPRFRAADVVILLDLSVWKCWWQSIVRIGHHEDFPANGRKMSVFLALAFFIRILLFKAFDRVFVFRAIRRTGTPLIRLRRWSDEDAALAQLRNM